jgi:hypothetical protein
MRATREPTVQGCIQMRIPLTISPGSATRKE